MSKPTTRPKPVPVDLAKPDPKCWNCEGRGAYPLGETAGMMITVRCGKPVGDPIPCVACWSAVINSGSK